MHPSIERARELARERHAGQTRKGLGNEPYFIHLEEVAARTARLGGSTVAVCAAWLHDTIEDCPPTSAEELRALCGPEVAAVVLEVTDDKALPKAERKRLQVLNAPRKSPDAALVKLCDKTSNVRAIGVSPPRDWSQDRMLAYLDWAAEVVGALPQAMPEGRAEFARTLEETRAAIAGEQQKGRADGATRPL